MATFFAFAESRDGALRKVAFETVTAESFERGARDTEATTSTSRRSPR